METKKTIYISLFVLLGFLFQLLVHASLETYYIKLLLERFDTFGLGLTWNQWFVVHQILTVLLIVGGLALGYFQGQYWWRKIYIEQPEWFKKRKHFKW